ncbi:uncharacterized protein Tco025E_02798 [Trypanosoma conorhini]|uniref:Uncharacterized protein n=1 Tax=Trypanosoma conorhini TaxID=83891 RepID=A0A3R7LZ59_9TRYP|nr:uncharacterized protein Tco025E_02798 [Trypanosoma conorhini]RNF23506.1 hypothetical protein Tco025E_02798 [Trypanosoma conorhini]
MFVVKCEAAVLWHPAVHHSLLLLRALRQRHTLVLEPARPTTTTTRPDTFWRLSHPGRYLAIHAPGTSGAASRDGAEAATEEPPLPLLRAPEGGLRSVHSPQHILYFFAAAPEGVEHQRQLQAYLDAALVADHVLRAVDDVLLARSTTEMEATRQTHSQLIDLVTRLETSLESDGDDVPRETEHWSTWPLFTTLKFLVEEAGLLLGPFPRVARAYHQLQGSKPVVAHSRLVNRTVQLTLSGAGSSVVPPPPWAHRGFLREVQRQLADYTADPAERMMDGVSGEKGPLKARVSGARFGLQPVSARMPWTMQRARMGKP